jgi:hypothetical protein
MWSVLRYTNFYCRCDSLLRAAAIRRTPRVFTICRQVKHGLFEESISSLSSTSEGIPGREKSNAQGLSGDSCFPRGEVYSREAGFRAHLLGPTAVDVARDHGAEGGHLWAMKEEGEASDIGCLALTRRFRVIPRDLRSLPVPRCEKSRPVVEQRA